MLTQRLAIEAAAIAAFESHVRADNLNPTSWRFLTVAERQEWRYIVVQLVKKETA